MNILIIDTATKIEIVALSKGAEFFEEINEVELSHSATLFKSIDMVIKKSGLKLKNLNLIAVGIGPGSFTGLRIAVTTARMFAQILKLPVMGIKTPLLYAYSAAKYCEQGENILVAFDAKKSRVFGALYSTGGNTDLNELVSPGDYKIEFLLGKIYQDKKTVLIGDGCEKYYNQIKPVIQNNELLAKFKPSGEIICRLVQKIYSENPGGFRDLTKVVPFYARKSDAEIMKEMRE